MHCYAAKCGVWVQLSFGISGVQQDERIQSSVEQFDPVGKLFGMVSTYSARNHPGLNGPPGRPYKDA
jgi:hypothetical protein